MASAPTPGKEYELSMKYTPPTICLVLGVLAALNAVAAVVFTVMAFSGTVALVVPAVGAGGGMLLCFIADIAIDLLARIEFNTSRLVHEATKEEEARQKNAGSSPAALPPAPALAKVPGFVQVTPIVLSAAEQAQKRRKADEAWLQAQRGE
jgi:hypothetical protein